MKMVSYPASYHIAFANRSFVPYGGGHIESGWL